MTRKEEKSGGIDTELVCWRGSSIGVPGKYQEYSIFQ